MLALEPSVRLRSRSIARCLAVAMSQAPGLSGTPDSGHCSSAATSASWASSSARPTSRTMRARPAISRADSILQTASIARCVSGAVTGTDELPRRRCKPPSACSCCCSATWARRRSSCSLSSGVSSAPKSSASKTWRISISRPAVEGGALDPLDRLVLRLHLDQPEAGDQLLRLGERPVDDGPLAAGELDTRALRARVEPFAGEHHAGLHQLLVVLAHRGEQLLAREARPPPSPRSP